MAVDSHSHSWPSRHISIYIMAFGAQSTNSAINLGDHPVWRSRRRGDDPPTRADPPLYALWICCLPELHRKTREFHIPTNRVSSVVCCFLKTEPIHPSVRMCLHARCVTSEYSSVGYREHFVGRASSEKKVVKPGPPHWLETRVE